MADLMTLKKFEALGPFEIKNELINLAKATSKTTQSAFLDAGRGNPNWVATTPREGFFLLGQFAITESKRTMEESPGIGGMPQAKGIAARLDAWLAKHLDMPGADFLRSMVKFAIKTFGFDPDAFVHDPGDSIALGTPIFTPYLEMTHLEDYDLKMVPIRAPQENRFQYTEEEIKKLEDPKIKAFFIVNPGNPSGMGMSRETIAMIVKLVKTKRPDLMLLTDDVYGTFVDDFRSLLGELPQNTIGVYSYSKYFGCTGWRLGVIAIHEDNIFDKMIAKLPDQHVQALDKRYGPITLEPRKFKFIDRIVADSRDIGLNHTAGLSLPQQVMMTMFSLYELMDEKKDYQKACMEIVHRRARAMIDSMALELSPNPNYDAYYGLIDFEFWARKNIGDEAVEYLKKNVHPLDLAFRLAEANAIVLLICCGFQASNWSIS